MKAIIDWVTAGRVQTGSPSYSFVARTMGVYITTRGGTASGSVSGQHVTEYSISVPGKSYTFKYWRPSSATQVCIAFLDENDTLLDAVYGGSSGQRTGTYTTPAGCTKVLVYGIYRSGNYVYSEMTPVTSEGGVYEMEEIRVRAAGDAVSQVVWPTEERYVISSITVRHYNRSGNSASVIPAAGGYATASGTIQVYRGSQLLRTFTSALTFDAFAGQNQQIISGNGDHVNRFEVSASYPERVYGAYLSTNNVSQYSISIRWTYQDLAYTNANVTQSRNAITSSSTSKHYTNISFELSEADLQPTGGTVTAQANASYTTTTTHIWTSGSRSYTYGSGIDEDVTPTYIYCSPTGVQYNWPTFTFPANTGSSDKDYTITVGITGTSQQAEQVVTVLSSGSVPMTLSSLTLVNYYYPEVESGLGTNMIPASGNQGNPVYPVVEIRGVTSTGVTVTGGVDGGETSVLLTGGSVNINAAISYLQNNSADSTNGRVEVQSRGTTEDTSNTVARSGLSVRITAGSRTATSGTITVYQQRNRLIEHRASSFQVDSLTCAPKAGSSTGTTLPMQAGVYRIETPIGSPIYLDIRVTGRGTTEYFHYTAVTIGGTYENYTNAEVPQTDIINFSVIANSVSVPVTNKTFTATNTHTLNEKTYACSGSYQETSFAVSIVQNQDSQVTSGVTPIVRIVGSANTLWAGGGTAEFVVTAYDEAGLRWQSDGSLVDGSEPVQTDRTDNIILTPVASSSDAYPLIQLIGTDTTAHTKTYRVSHRDMTTNVTTDTLSVSASNGSAQSSALSYSVSNALEATEYEEEGEVVWGGSYPIASNYGATLTLDNYNSQSAPAPFYGGTTSYTASAYHDVSDYHDGTVQINTYRRYTSWSAEKDDSSHKELVSTTYDTSRYRGVLITGSTRRITSDGFSLSGPSWVSINISTAVITINAQEDNDARAGDIVATNTTDPNHATASRTIYQAAYASLEALVESFIFEPGGGNGRFDISWIRTGWNVTHSASGGEDPITFIRPLSGGSTSGRNTETIEFTVGANPESVPIFAEIAITPTTEGLDTVYVDVMVKTSATPPVHHDYEGYANCVWLNEYRFEYNAIIRTDSPTTLSDIYLLIASTDSESVNPDSHGQLERRIRLGAITTSGSDSVVVRGEYSMNRESGKYYWAILEGVYSEYMPFEEAESPE